MVKLKEISDSKYVDVEGFQFQFKNSKAYFKVGKDSHVFGSKIYPIGKRGQSFFGGTCTEDTGSKYDRVADTLERSNWKHKNGYCYTNAEILQQIFQAHGVDAKYYSGWVFVSSGYPIHHAWVVVDDNVYDISINVVAQQRMLEQSMKGMDLYSPEAVKEIKRIQNDSYSITDSFVWGKVPDHMIYVGSEETQDTGRAKYHSAMKATNNNHPSYAKMNKQRDRNFRSKYQSLLEQMD